MKIITPIALLVFISLSQRCMAQEYVGSWTLDWSQVMESDSKKSTTVPSDLKSRNNNSDKNPVWVLSIDSLKVFQAGSMISGAEIKWTRNDRFEIIDEEKKNNPIHYIDDLDDGKIKMRAGYSDSEIYLRRL